MRRPTLVLNAEARTHVGQLRKKNEDAFLVRYNLLAVADGLGGHQGGEVASAVAVDVLSRHAKSGWGAGLRNNLPGRNSRNRRRRTSEILRRAFHAAHYAVLEQAAKDVSLADMGTTLCALALDPDNVVVLANVGDSRIYRLLDGVLEQLTWDHTVLNESVMKRGFDFEMAMDMINPLSLSRAIGVFPESPEVDTWEYEAVAGHRYLLSSDGLTNELDDAEIAKVLIDYSDPAEASEELVRRANEHGGKDNITTVVADLSKREG